MVIPVMEFQVRDTKLERFLPKNQLTQRKVMNTENWCSGEVSESAKIVLLKTIFSVINHWNLSQFFVIEEYHFRSTFFVF